MEVDLREQQDDLKQLVAEILAEAQRQGADQAEVSVSLDAGLSVSVRQGALENLEFNQDRGFGITLYVGQRKGSASTTDSSRQAIHDTVAAARNIARYTEDDACNGLADAARMPVELADLDLFHPQALTPEAATQIATECENAGLAVDPRLTNSEGAQVSTQQSLRVYGNSHGFIGAYAGTRHGLNCVLIGQDAQGMQRDYWYTVARSAGDMQSPAEVGRQAGQRTVARLSPRAAPTGVFPVLFSPSAASGLFGHLIGALSGGALYRKASFLLDSLGQVVAPTWLSLVEQPHLRGALGSANFDGDGVATRSQAFVEEGRVASYVMSTYSARKLGLESTGNAGGVHNLQVLGQQTSTQTLIQQMRRGLIVNELVGQGINA